MSRKVSTEEISFRTGAVDVVLLIRIILYTDKSSALAPWQRRIDLRLPLFLDHHQMVLTSLDPLQAQMGIKSIKC